MCSCENCKSLKTQKKSKSKSGGGNDLLDGIYFTKGPGKYKYSAHLPNGKKVNFGHRDYEHYYDSVPSSLGGKLWSSKDHLDKKRRDNYRKRHGGVLTKDGNKAFKKVYSPSWFSYNYLW